MYRFSCYCVTEVDMDEVEDREVKRIKAFVELRMAHHIPNQPVHADGRLDCQVGHRWFPRRLSQAIGSFGPAKHRAVA